MPLWRKVVGSSTQPLWCADFCSKFLVNSIICYMYLTSSLNLIGTMCGLGKLGRHKVHDFSTSNEPR